MDEKSKLITARVDAALTAVGRGRSTGGRLKRKTIKEYRRYQAEWEVWRRPRGYPNAATSEALAVWAGDLLQHGYAVASVRVRLNAVKSLCRERGWPVPDGVAAWSVLRGDDLTPGGGGKVNNGPARARRDVLAQVVRGCDQARTPQAAARDRCLVTLAFDILASVSELVRLNIAHVQPHPGRDEAGDGLLVRLGNDAGQPRWLRVFHDHQPAEVCAVCGAGPWLDILRAGGAPPGSPMFRPVDKGGNIAGLTPRAGHSPPQGRLNVRGLAKVWQACCVRAGVEPMPPRQLRLGGAEDDVARGAGIVAVLRRGRWSTTSRTMTPRLVATAEQATGQAEERAGGQG